MVDIFTSENHSATEYVEIETQRLANINKRVLVRGK